MRLARSLVLLVLLGALLAPGASAQDQQTVRLFFTAGEQFETVERRLPATGTTLLPTLRALFKGPSAAERGRDIDTQIPRGVRIERIVLTGRGAAVVELSAAFVGKIPADPAQRSEAQAATLSARLAQVIYTVTQFGDIRRAEVRSGGLTLDADLERGDFTKPRGRPPVEKPPPGPPVAGTREVQERLVRLGYLPASAVDGLFGYRTQQAVMAFQSWEGLGRDGIVGPATTAALSTARRPRPRRGAGPRRRIEVYRAKGVALLVRGGRTLRAIHVSTGAGVNATPTGRYKVFRKELRSWSVPFSVWLPYASYFNNGIAFHEYADVPPFPASHGCVRVPAPEAPFVYEFASFGTTVVVF
jgi:hypothetical protein